jgi:hypothetical protein
MPATEFDPTRVVVAAETEARGVSFDRAVGRPEAGVEEPDAAEREPDTAVS